MINYRFKVAQGSLSLIIFVTSLSLVGVSIMGSGYPHLLNSEGRLISLYIIPSIV